MPQQQQTFIQTVIADGIRSNPEAAAREVPEMVGHYLINNTRLNRVYQCACNVLIHPDHSNMERLRLAVADAEGELE